MVPLRSRLLPWLVPAIVFLSLLPAQAGGTVPCVDPRGCPDLVVDAAQMTPVLTQQTFSSSHCAVQEGSVEPGTRRLIRFNFVTPNVGPGDLVVGSVYDHPEWFEWSSCHGHYHFIEYADYRLWTPSDWATWDAYRTANPGETAGAALAATGLSPVVGSKAGFCVIDVLPYGGASLPKYDDCDFNQGISTGWADAYTLTLDGQWVDVTGLPAGTYVLEAEVNAEWFYVETNYANNRGWIQVAVPP